MIPANNPSLQSWVEVPADSDFPIQNLPFGVFRTEANSEPRVCTRIGDFVVDLSIMDNLAYFDELDLPFNIFKNRYLNDFMALGKERTSAVRNRLSECFQLEHTDTKTLSVHFLHDIEKVELLMPVKVGDYTDFYSSKNHAYNLGCLFRDPENALLENWLHIPVGYHGRASSIVISGTDIHRPKGQTKPNAAEPPVFGASRLLDFELEMAFVVGKSSELGERVDIKDTPDYIFGMVLFNDWSARDIQKWEYVPLGPFLGKSFASTISPWVVTMDALEPFRTESPAQEPTPLDYLQLDGNNNHDIKLQVAIQPESGEEAVVSNSNYKYMYWNMYQQLAHHTVNGCNLNVGDMCASGTISGTEKGSYGSMLEITWRGTDPVKMPDGTSRKFIADGDTVIMRGHAEKDGVRVGFGEARGKILPAK